MDFKHHPKCGCYIRSSRTGDREIVTIQCEAYDAGVREGEARATRAIVADLRTAHSPVVWWRKDKGLLNALADRYEAGHHLAAKADGGGAT